MRALGITAVVNMREEADDAERGVALDHYLWLPTTDDTPPTMADFTRGASFIAEQIKAGHGVYIHCAAGVGRAPSMAAAYLIHTGMAPDAAWETVRQGRPFIRPTPPQIEALKAFSAAQSQNSRNGIVEHPVRDENIECEVDVSFSVPPAQLPSEVAAWVQAAIERIAENPSLTEDLTDSDARAAIEWAQREIRRLALEAQPRDAASATEILQPKLRHLQRYLRRTAKLSAASDDPVAMLQSLLVSPLAYPAEGEP